MSTEALDELVKSGAAVKPRIQEVVEAVNAMSVTQLHSLSSIAASIHKRLNEIAESKPKPTAYRFTIHRDRRGLVSHVDARPITE